MSAKTASREVRVTRPVTVYICDGPECKKTVDVPMHQDGVPPGWIMTSMIGSNIGALSEIRHYCSRDCLADAVVP